MHLYEFDVPYTHELGTQLQVWAGGLSVALTLPDEARRGSLIGIALSDDGELLRSMVVAAAAEPDEEDELPRPPSGADLLAPGSHLYPKLWRTSVCPSGVPRWLANELSDPTSDRPDQVLESVAAARRRCVSADSDERASTASRLIPPQPGERRGPAVDIPRVRIDALAPAAFYRRFVRTGLPVVLVGAHLGARANSSEGRARWEGRRDAIRAAREGRLLDPRFDIGGCSAAGCERVHLCAEACQEAARMQAEDVPAVFAFGAPSSDLVDERHFNAPEIFSGSSGQQFGGPKHFDAACDGSISVQYEGTKHWSLWSPFPITTDADADSDAAGQGHAYPPRTFPTHTRFETTLEEGDSLFFAPGFYHGTRILTPPSIAAAYFFISPPVFGAVDAAAYAGSPFGFESCYWPAKAAEWRGRMEAQGRREDGTLR